MQIKKVQRLELLTNDYEIIVFLCYDNDVFEYGMHPQVDREKLKKELLESGAKGVKEIIAYRNIEDYLMIDEKGILKFLKLKPTTRINGKTGLDKIKNIFNRANRTYIKGKKLKV